MLFLIGITEIPEYCFNYCTKLETLTIPTSVETIEYGNFFRTPSLKTINYKGTQEQWNEIIIKDNNPDLSRATINYNYTE